MDPSDYLEGMLKKGSDMRNEAYISDRFWINV